MFKKLWNDDAGIVALEYLLVATIVGLGLVVGLGALSFGLNAELTELAEAISFINQSYGMSGTSVSSFGSSQGGPGAFGAYKAGWAVTDIQTGNVDLTAISPAAAGGHVGTVDQLP